MTITIELYWLPIITIISVFIYWYWPGKRYDRYDFITPLIDLGGGIIAILVSLLIWAFLK